MSAFSKIYHIRHLLVTTLLLPMLCACMFDNDLCEDDIAAPQIATDNQYINLNIVVSSGHENTTRAAIPSGGEDGDGREAGYERENKVNGVTLMLYEVTRKEDKSYTGINDITDNDQLAFIQYYPVQLVKPEAQGTSPDIEAVYTTGDQPLNLKDAGLQIDKTYRALVVANLDLSKVFDMTTTMKEVRDYEVPSQIYDGSNLGATATDFVMSLETEENTIINFQTPTSETTSSNGQIVKKFQLDNIRIERLSARMDFWAKGAQYKNTYKTPGYEYKVYEENSKKVSPDKFVLTTITPFNLYNGTEYLFKRVRQNNRIIYLGKEVVTTKDTEDNYVDNYVLDPYTLKKDKTNIPDNTSEFMRYEFWLDNIINDNTTGTDRVNPPLSMESFQKGGQWNCALYQLDEADNIIVCYPKENTLLKDSPLYYYATGLCIEGDYYEEGWEETQPTTTDGENPKVKHLTYYGFLRHQGEQIEEEYYAIMSPEDLDQKKGDLTGNFPMNFGVVRNNIYRISIDHITEKGEMKLKIILKNWDQFEHHMIYM